MATNALHVLRSVLQFVNNLRDSYILLYRLHRDCHFVEGVNTIPRIRNLVVWPRTNLLNINLFCNVSQTMADTENFQSMLPQPTRSSAGLRALNEITPSDNNTRNTLPAPVAGHKRQGSNLPEPSAKRKTNAERSGESMKSAIAVPRSTYNENTFPKADLKAYRSASNLSLSSYRSGSNTSRTTSNSSYAVGAGSIRAPSAQSLSGLTRSRSTIGRDKSKDIEGRPVTSVGQHGGSNEITKAKRMDPFSLPIAPRIRDFSQPNALAGERALLNTGRRLGVEALPSPRRNPSLTTQMQQLSLGPLKLQRSWATPSSPSRLPRPASTAPALPKVSSFVIKSPSKSPKKVQYLTRFSDLEALDVDEHYKDFKRMFEDYQHLYKETLGKVTEAKDENHVYKSAITKLEDERSSQTATIISLSSETETLRYRLETAEKSISEQQQSFKNQLEQMRLQNRKDLDALREDQRHNIEQLKSTHRTDLQESKQKYEAELEHERSQRVEAISQASTQGVLEKQKQQMELDLKDHEIRLAKAEIENMTKNLEREKQVNDDLRKNLMDAGNSTSQMEMARQALQKKIEFLESDNKSQSEAYAQMEQRMTEALQEADEAMEKLRKEESLRRKLHNQVQELKGNIRVFCRVRPTLSSEQSEELTKMNFPDTEDNREIEVKGQDETSSLGKTTTKTYPFAFDRVFDPASSNNEIFDEIRQLVQSALDGYNVCIFAYGQTGSGKTYTMSSDDGMIPRALRQIYSTSKDLEERGWKYSMEGSFVEVYNEELRDLLGKDGENKKYEIRHDMVKCETTITDVTTVDLDSQDQVESILERAMAKRSVAATKANERSSRSHSVFILKLVGENNVTGEKSRGTLNLVDLAGSERLSHSKVEGQRLKETQSINKSLSCLGDVIGALGQQGASPAFDPRSSVNGSAGVVGAHIPYRNSKLTYLLQFSLGGNSKTLMFVMVAPEKKCLGETITSLKFAEKVSRTKIGVAKKVR